MTDGEPLFLTPAAYESLVRTHTRYRDAQERAVLAQTALRDLCIALAGEDFSLSQEGGRLVLYPGADQTEPDIPAVPAASPA